VSGSGPEEKVVLIAEDEPNLRKIYGLRLRRRGFTVVETPDGELALEALRELLEDGARVVAILDIMMPKMDGISFLKAVRADEDLRHLPVIVTSAVRDDKTRGELDALGVECALPKPFRHEELLAAVERAFERGRGET